MNAAPQQDLFTEKLDSFFAFHRDNPEVYRLFCQYTFQLINAGYQKGSAREIVERVRWHSKIETRGSQFKINNNHIPAYAKMFMESYPEHEGFFETRSRNAL
jgi:hypothetical protein